MAGVVEHGTPKSNTHAQHAFSISIFSSGATRHSPRKKRIDKRLSAPAFETKSKRLYFVGFRVLYKGKSTRFPNIKAQGAKRLLVNDSNDGQALRNIHLVGAPHTPCVEIPNLGTNHEMINEANSKNE